MVLHEPAKIQKSDLNVAVEWRKSHDFVLSITSSTTSSQNLPVNCLPSSACETVVWLVRISWVCLFMREAAPTALLPKNFVFSQRAGWMVLSLNVRLWGSKYCWTKTLSPPGSVLVPLSGRTSHRCLLLFYWLQITFKRKWDVAAPPPSFRTCVVLQFRCVVDHCYDQPLWSVLQWEVHDSSVQWVLCVWKQNHVTTCRLLNFHPAMLDPLGLCWFRVSAAKLGKWLQQI